MQLTIDSILNFLKTKCLPTIYKIDCGNFFAFGGERMDKFFFIGGFLSTLLIVAVVEEITGKNKSKSNG